MGASAGGQSWGMRQPVEGVGSCWERRSSLLPSSLSHCRQLQERPESGGAGCCLRPTPTLRPHCPVCSCSDSTASGKALTRSTNPDCVTGAIAGEQKGRGRSPANLLAKRTAWSKREARPPLPPVRECRLRAAGSPLNEALHECFYPLTLGRDFQTAWRNAVTPHRVEEALLLGAEHAACNRGAESDGRADRCLSKTYGLEESEPVTQGAAWTMYSMRGRARRRRIRGEDLGTTPCGEGGSAPHFTVAHQLRGFQCSLQRANGPGWPINAERPDGPPADDAA